MISLDGIAQANRLLVIAQSMREVLDSIELLRRDPPHVHRRSLLSSLNDAASAAMRTVDTMLDCLEIEAGAEPTETRDFDLKGTIRTAADLFSCTAAGKGLALDHHGLDGEPVVVRGDHARLKQLLSNLIGYAIESTQSGEVSIRLSPTRSGENADHWMIIVRDTGDGTGPCPGESQQLAEAMGGSMAMGNDPGKGSIFSVELPFAHADGDALIGRAADSHAAPMRILLAEDNPINRRLMAALLIREGHDVTAVEDGRRAVAAITAQSFDLVLMDMQMPRLDGISATRAIRALDAPACDTPILAISADSNPQRRRIYFDGGIDNFLPKPIVAGQLLHMITRMRRGKRGPADAGGDRFDRERLNMLVEQAGGESAALMMKMLLSDLDDRPRRIGAAMRAQLWDLAAAEAEALRTLLNGFGSFSLARLLASIRRQSQRQQCPPAIVDELFEQARALATMLQQFAAPPTEVADEDDDVAEPHLVLGGRN